jgi:hypothetical protein
LLPLSAAETLVAPRSRIHKRFAAPAAREIPSGTRRALAPGPGFRQVFLKRGKAKNEEIHYFLHIYFYFN